MSEDESTELSEEEIAEARESAAKALRALPWHWGPCQRFIYTDDPSVFDMPEPKRVGGSDVLPKAGRDDAKAMRTLLREAGIEIEEPATLESPQEVRASFRVGGHRYQQDELSMPAQVGVHVEGDTLQALLKMGVEPEPIALSPVREEELRHSLDTWNKIVMQQALEVLPEYIERLEPGKVSTKRDALQVASYEYGGLYARYLQGEHVSEEGLARAREKLEDVLLHASDIEHAPLSEAYEVMAETAKTLRAIDSEPIQKASALADETIEKTEKVADERLGEMIGILRSMKAGLNRRGGIFGSSEDEAYTTILNATSQLQMQLDAHVKETNARTSPEECGANCARRLSLLNKAIEQFMLYPEKEVSAER